MSTALQISLIVLVLALLILATLYFFGKKAQKKQEASQEQIEAMKQTVPILVIDKKKLRLKQSGLPAIVLEKTPVYLRFSKVPVVKAKIGPKVMTLMCDAKIYDMIPVKKEVKADISGIYITGVRGIRGPLEVPVKTKKKWFSRKSK